MMAIEPITRQEMFMAKASGEDAPELKPITRREMFLAKAGGQDIEIPTPITREEMFLKKIAEGGGSGGGGSGGDLDALIDGSITEITSNAKIVRKKAFYYLDWVTKVNLPKAEIVNDYSFSKSGITSVYLPMVTEVLGLAFENCTKLKSIVLPMAVSISDYAFRQCSNLVTADFSKLSSIGNYTFNSCSQLRTLILRSETKCTLKNGGAFGGYLNTGEGYIYVPRALIDSYKVATNWVRFADQFRALEDYTVDGTTTGELDESKVNA